MFGTISEEIEVKVAASEAWKIYGTLYLTEFIVEHLPHMIQKIDILEGDGGAGTVMRLTLPPGTPGISSYKEKYTVVDDEKRVKVAEAVEGGYLNLGVESYQVRLEIIEKQKDGEEEEEDWCITKITVEYKTQDIAAAGLAVNSIQSFMTVVKAISDHLANKTQKNSD